MDDGLIGEVACVARIGSSTFGRFAPANKRAKPLTCRDVACHVRKPDGTQHCIPRPQTGWHPALHPTSANRMAHTAPHNHPIPAFPHRYPDTVLYADVACHNVTNLREMPVPVNAIPKGIAGGDVLL